MGSRNSTVIPVTAQAPGRLTVNGAAVQGPSVQCHGVLVRGICPGQTIYIGVGNGVLTTTGYPLSDGEEKQFEIDNLNQLWFIASAAAQAIAYFPYTWV